MRWAVLALALLSGPLVAELSLRFALFSDSALAHWIAERWRLRNPALYADQLTDDDHWKLQRLFLPTEAQRLAEPRLSDPRLGWRSPAILANYDHSDRDALAARRPLLLYGASYCTEHFDELFAASELAGDYGALNYSVGGYGPDQVLLLLAGSLDHFSGRDPVVVIGLEVNGDFDRAMLSFRNWPKPHARVTPAGEALFDDAPLPSVAEYLERHPVEISSYVLRALSENWLPDGARAARERARRDTKAAQIGPLVLAIDRELRSRGLEYFYVLFNDQDDCRGWHRAWAEDFLVETFEREGIAYELARPVVQKAAAARGEEITDYFVQPPHERCGHPTRRGMEVLLDCWRAGLAKLRR